MFQNNPNDTRHVFITSTDPTKKLTSFNPIKLQKDIDSICGPVNKVEYQRSGSLLITTETIEQVQKLLKAKQFNVLNITITASVAWTRHFSYGKLYAREFLEDSIEEILEALEPHKVVSVRKLYTDPNKVNIPLYVLTFLGPCPSVLRVGYVQYKIDKYYSKPLQCRSCWRLRHSTNNCRSQATCTYCSSTSHTKAECNAETPSCINCKGVHESISPSCPMYKYETQICAMQAEQGISFSEARMKIGQQQSCQSPDIQRNNEEQMTTPRNTQHRRNVPDYPIGIYNMQSQLKQGNIVAPIISSNSFFPPLPNSHSQPI